MTTSSAKPASWRDIIKIHPAADLFPLMTADELKTLGEDIKVNGLKTSIAYSYTKTASGPCKYWLIDGRNRLDAMELVGLDPRLTLKHGSCFLHCDPDWEMDHEIPDPQRIDQDPWTYVISANIHRRHLNTEQKRELIANVLKAQPEKSNRLIAEQTKTYPKAVASVRAEQEQLGKIPQLEKTVGKDRKARKPPAPKPAPDKTKAHVKAVADRAEERSQQTRRTTAQMQQAAQAVLMPKPRAVPGVAMHAHAERGHDLYETPDVAVRALLAVEQITGWIWECAAGRGAIACVLRGAGHDVIATDLHAYDGRIGIIGRADFLQQQRAPDRVELILTNPPYRYANKFVRHALTLVPKVVMLLPLRFLEGKRRSDILDGGQLARIYVFRERLPMMHRDGWQGRRASSQIAFGWFVWDRGHRGPAELYRISWKADGPSIADRAQARADASAAAAPAQPSAPAADAAGIPAFLDRRAS